MLHFVDVEPREERAQRDRRALHLSQGIYWVLIVASSPHSVNSHSRPLDGMFHDATRCSGVQEHVSLFKWNYLYTSRFLNHFFFFFFFFFLFFFSAVPLLDEPPPPLSSCGTPLLARCSSACALE